jgi:hypothetical protein
LASRRFSRSFKHVSKSVKEVTKTICPEGPEVRQGFGGPPGSRSRHLGIKSPLLYPMS